MHVIYENEENWDLFFNQIGYGYFEGVPFRRENIFYQKGRGIGSILGGIGSFLIPIIKKYGKNLTNEGLKMGSNILNDLSEGAELKPSFKKHTKKSLNNMIKTQHGSGKKHHSIIGRKLRAVDKKIRSDPFE